jgi:hypothetical protein
MLDESGRLKGRKTQPTRNMAAGASTADAVVVLIDASKGVLSQPRRHACIASLLRMSYVLVAVNKMELIGGSIKLRNEWLARCRFSRSNEELYLAFVKSALVLFFLLRVLIVEARITSSG